MAAGNLVGNSNFDGTDTEGVSILGGFHNGWVKSITKKNIFHEEK